MKTQDDIFNEWSDHMNGVKISPRLKARGVGLAVNSEGYKEFKTRVFKNNRFWTGIKIISYVTTLVIMFLLTSYMLWRI